MDSNYPIDIHIHKLLDWLISRKICDNAWITDIKTVRDKIRHALEDMPEHKDIAQLLSGSYLHYFYALKIVNILKQTEADSKNIFGKFSLSCNIHHKNDCNIHFFKYFFLQRHLIEERF